MTRRALLAAFLISTCAATAAPAAQAPAAGRPPRRRRKAPGERLHRLFRDSDEASLRRNPLSAHVPRRLSLCRHGSATSAPTPISPPSRPRPSRIWRRCAAIDRTALNPTDRIAYDVFKYQREDDLRDLQPDLLALTAVRPINHFTGFHTFYPVFASGRSAAPFRNVEDYENNLKRHREFVEAFDRAIARFRQGLASGVVETKLTIRNVIGQLDTQLARAARAIAL